MKSHGAPLSNETISTNNVKMMVTLPTKSQIFGHYPAGGIQFPSTGSDGQPLP